MCLRGVLPRLRLRAPVGRVHVPREFMAVTSSGPTIPLLGTSWRGDLGSSVRVEADRLNMHQLDCESEGDEGDRGGSENSSRWKVAEKVGRDG